MHNDNAHREIEERLARLQSPPPPADLLQRIRDDIPDHLQPVAEPSEEPPARGRRSYRLLAASLLVATVGGLLAYRVFRDAPDPGVAFEPRAVTTPEPPRSAERPAERPSTTAAAEVAPESAPPAPPADPEPADRGTLPAAPSAPPAAVDEAMKKQPTGPDEEYRGRRDNDGATRRAATEVGADALASKLSELSDADTAAPPAAPPAERDEVQATGSVGNAELGAAAGQPEAISEELIVVSAPHRRKARRERREREIGVAPEGKRIAGFEDRRQEAAAPSTGGSAEPNDQPYGDMFFRAWGTNPFVDTEDDPQSTFGLDVDTGSYTVARSYLERGHLPPPEAIRVEELINYFDYRDPAPRRGEFTLTAEGAPSPWARGPRYQLLRIGLRGREVDEAQRKQATLIFVVDVSGSMARENRIGLVKRALHLLLDQLRPDDRVGLVVYGSRGRVLLEPSGDLRAVRWAIDRLTTGGSTNAEEGLVLAYDLARSYLRPGAINRIILCSDGVANVGRTGPESILERVGREAEEGIELTTVGFGMGNYNDLLMEQLADQGDGNYAYVDTLEEARRVFVENLTGTLQTIAGDAKVQVEFDPRTVSRYRLLGYENRDVADHRFRDDTVDAGEIGAGHTVTALYEIKLAEGAPRRGALGEVRLRYRSKASGQVVEDSLELRRSLLARSWSTAAPSLRLAAVAAELGELLKGSYWAKESDPRALLHRAEQVARELRGDPDVAELARLVRQAVRLIEHGREAGE